MRPRRTAEQIQNSIPVDIVDKAIEGLRRASDEVLQSGARRYFVPRGTKIRIDMNIVIGLLLRGLAQGIERRATRKPRKKRVG